MHIPGYILHWTGRPDGIAYASTGILVSTYIIQHNVFS